MVLSGFISAILGLYFCRRSLQGKAAWKHLAVKSGKEKLVVSREWKGTEKVEPCGGGRNRERFLVIGF